MSIQSTEQTEHERTPPPWGLILSAFVNKCGTLGIALLPMLLIEYGFTQTQSSLILSCTKAAEPVSFLLGGVAINALGVYPILLVSFLISAVGLVIAPMTRVAWLVLLGGVLAQFGTSLFNPAARSLIRADSAKRSLKENLAWLRTANNLGKVVASGVAMLVGKFGLMIPFLFDAFTSLVAFALGWFVIPSKPAPQEGARMGWNDVERGYYLYSTALLFYFFVYELGYMSFAALAKIRMGTQGIQAFALASLVNTAMCGFAAVPAQRWFRDSRWSLQAGTLLTAAGALLCLYLGNTFLSIALASFVFTLGEVIFTVHSQVLLLANSPATGGSGHYGVSLTIQSLGRYLAGWALFPIVINGVHPAMPFFAGALGFFALFYVLPGTFLDGERKS